MIGYWGYLMFEVNSDWWQYPAEIERTAKGRYDTYIPLTRLTGQGAYFLAQM